MKKDLTEIVFILDRSGSMGGLTNDTIGGFNSFVKKQKNEKGNANLTTVLFDDKYEVLYQSVDIKDIRKLTDKEYYARGSTALLDSIGKTIHNFENRISELKVKDSPSKVIFVITTDGYENASREFKKEDIKKLVEEKIENNKWEFLFLGANIDAFNEGGNMGINPTTTSNFSATAKGVQTSYTAITGAVSVYRKTGEITPDWNKDIE